MTDNPVFLRRSLNAVQAGEFLVLDTLRWPTLFGSGLRIYFARSGSDPKTPVGAGVSISTKQRIAGQVIAMGKAPAGDGAVEMDLGDQPVTLPSCTPESELFDDLNVMVAQRHTETAQNVADWWQYHVTHHGLSGVV